MSTVERLIVVLLFPHVDLLDVTAPAEVYALLQRDADVHIRHRVLLAAESPDPVLTSAGVRVLPDVTFEQLMGRSLDTLVVPGGVLIDDTGAITVISERAIVERVRAFAARSRRVVSVAMGTHILADAGLLDGKRATTHWSSARQLAASHDHVIVDPDPIFIRQGNVWTGAGLSACLDLSLALVADDHGPEVAARIARQLVMFLRRPGGQSQFSVSVEPVSATRRVDELRQYIAANLTHRLTVADLAAFAHVTDRHITRVFKAELGMTPAAYVEQARVEAARQRLETTDETLSRIASACGFGTVSTLARAFRRTMDITPAEYRERSRAGTGP